MSPHVFQDLVDILCTAVLKDSALYDTLVHLCVNQLGKGGYTHDDQIPQQPYGQCNALGDD